MHFITILDVRFVFIASVLSLVATANDPANAQGALFNWKAVSPGMRECIGVAARRSNQTLEGIIAAGILPSDPRLADVFRVCQQFVDGLKANYRCRVKLPTGEPIETVCDQYFGMRQGAGYRKITKAEAFQYAFTPKSAETFVVEEETADGRRAREDNIRRTLSGGTETAVSPPPPAVPSTKVDPEEKRTIGIVGGDVVVKSGPSPDHIFSQTEKNNCPREDWVYGTANGEGGVVRCLDHRDDAIIARQKAELAEKPPSKNNDDDGELSTQSKEIIVQVLRENGYSFVSSAQELECRKGLLLSYCNRRGQSWPMTRVTIAVNPARIGIQPAGSIEWSACFIASTFGYMPADNPQKCKPL